MNPFTQYIKNHVPPHWKPTSGGWISGNCPYCVYNGERRADTKRRGGFLFENDSVNYHCFNCNASIHWSPPMSITKKLETLLVSFGADTAEIKRFALNIFLNKDEHELIRYVRPPWKESVKQWREIELPDDTDHLFSLENITDNSGQYRALEYVIDRKLDFYDDWYYSKSLKYANRIILPLRFQYNIVGYTARWLGSRNVKYPKYLTTSPKDFVFNLDRQTYNKKIVFVTEGYIDAICTDGVAIGSNQLNENQAEIIESLGKRIILLPDKNEAGKRLVSAAIERGWEISFPPWDQDIVDVNDSVRKYGRLFTIKTAIEYSIDNKLKAKIQSNFWCK